MSMADIVISTVGDIVTKPFEIIGNQLEHWQGRKDAEQRHRQDIEKARSEQERAQIQQRFEQEQAQQQQQFDARQEEQRQRFQAELDDLVARKEIERAALVAQSIANYKKTMAECAVSIGESLGKMRIELLAEATKLVNEQQRICEEANARAFKNADDTFRKIADLPERQQVIMEKQLDKYLSGALDATKTFLETVDSEFKRLNSDIIVIVNQTIEQAGTYISLKTERALIGGEIKPASSNPK